MVKPIPSRERLEEMAAEANYRAPLLAKIWKRTPRHLRRQFQSALGCSPQRWLDELRLARARQMLLTGSSVKEVAFGLGFKKPSHFCRHFKERTGMTPSQFVLGPLAAAEMSARDNKCPRGITVGR